MPNKLHSPHLSCLAPLIRYTSLILSCYLTFSHSFLFAQDLILTGVMDGTLSGGTPKVVELFARNRISDLSLYGLGGANNGGGSDGEEFSFPAVEVEAGTFIYVATEAPNFITFFGFSPDYTTGSSGAASLNGDDAVELFLNEEVIDVFGEINEDGTGQAWEYTDGWAYRVNGSGPDATTFTIEHWSFSGIDALDDETGNDSAASPFPIGSYRTGPLFEESFEVKPGVNYTLSDPFDDGNFDFFNRFAVPDPENEARDDFSFGWDLEFGILGQDHNGGEGDATRTIALPNIDIGGLTDLEVVVALGALNSEPEFSNYETEDGDGIRILALIDSAAAFPIGGFAPRGGASDLYLDSDLDGVGDGPNLTTTLTDFSFPLPFPGNTLAILIELTTTDSFEPLAVDHVRVRRIKDNTDKEPEETFIHLVQGTGPSVTNPGEPVILSGIVIGDFQDTSQLRGFFIQEEDGDADDNPETSEGLFVFCGNCLVKVDVGDRVRVRGIPQENGNMSELNAANGTIEVVSSGNSLPTPVTLELPAVGSTRDPATFERVEGMLVRFNQPLAISEYFQLARYGELVLTQGGRPFQFTHNNEPSVEGFEIAQRDLAARRVILDDDNNIQNAPLPDGVFFHPQPNGFGVGDQGIDFFRGGDQIRDLTGIMHWSGAGFRDTEAWRIRPVTTQFPIRLELVNRRQNTPEAIQGNIRVSSFNVLNYFTTLDARGNQAGPMGESPRGASSEDELNRQTIKLVEAVKGIDADVIGLTELENNGDEAIGNLVQALNAEMGADTYAFISTGVIGIDVITTGIIYKPGKVIPKGNTAVLATNAFLDPNNTNDQRNRPTVAQAFEVTETNNPDFGEAFVVAVNHFKSKGPSGVNANTPDGDQGDGQGNWNDTRTKAALELLAWLASDPTDSGDPDVMIIGDLNGYRMEDPLMALKDAGYTDLVEAFEGEGGYSFVFDGQIGYLDYAFANASLLPQVTGIDTWHINSDEVNVFDYNNTLLDGDENFFEAKPTGNPLFEENPFRSSDHDPVIIGMDLQSGPVPVTFRLIDAENDQEIGPLSDGDVIDVRTLPSEELGIQYVPTPGFFGSVVFELDGPISRTRTENFAPYSLFGDDPGTGNFYGRRMPPGRYTLKVTPYSAQFLEGERGNPIELSFTVAFNAPTSLELKLTGVQNADIILEDLDSGLIINSGLEESRFNVVADFQAEGVRSVKFKLAGPLAVERVENVAPFFLFGDDPQADINYARNLPDGDYQLEVTGFTGANGSGLALDPEVVRFTVLSAPEGQDIRAGSRATNTGFSIQGPLQIRGFPNPASSQITLEVSGDLQGRLLLSIHDMAGRQVQAMNVQKDMEVLQQTIPLGQLASGFYIVRVQMLDNGQNSILKFQVKQ